MRIVHKTILKITDAQIIHLPKGAMILAVQNQQEQVCLWYECDPEAESMARSIIIAGTGHVLPDTFKRVYIGTVQMAGGALVWHVYEAT